MHQKSMSLAHKDLHTYIQTHIKFRMDARVKLRMSAKVNEHALENV